MAYKIKDPAAKSRPVHDTPLVSGKDRILLFVEQNRNAILIGLMIVVMGAVALGGLLWWHHQQREEALVLLEQAQKLYADRPIDQPDRLKQNMEQAIELFQRIVKEYPDTPSAGIALYLLGNALFDMGNVEQAIGAYRQFIEEYGSDEILLGFVYQRLGMAYLQQGEREKGIEVLSKVLSLPGATNKDQVLYELGKLQEMDGNTEQALAYYQELQNSFPYSPYANEADLRVKMLKPEEHSATQPEESKTGSEK